jgi:hypothetical protein
LRRWRKVDERKKRQDEPEDARGPADEYEALRERLLTALRRNPGDMRALMRLAATLSRMASSEGRVSGRKARDLAERFRAVLESVGDQILPPDG